VDETPHLFWIDARAKKRKDVAPDVAETAFRIKSLTPEMGRFEPVRIGGRKASAAHRIAKDVAVGLVAAGPEGDAIGKAAAVHGKEAIAHPIKNLQRHAAILRALGFKLLKDVRLMAEQDIGEGEAAKPEHLRILTLDPAVVHPAAKPREVVEADKPPSQHLM
jgi:hypothetical protein